VQDKVTRGLAYFDGRLADKLPNEYARVLSPVFDLNKDIIGRAIDEGTYWADLAQ
jgi:hypothetical protein